MARDAPLYLPDEADINYRALAVQWFSAHKWDTGLVDAIMYHDSPSIETVERLVHRLGPDLAYNLLLRMHR